jgi:chromosome segregation ATPase
MPDPLEAQPSQEHDWDSYQPAYDRYAQDQVEQQLTSYQTTIAEQDDEIFQLRQTVQEWQERCQVLEQVIQEFPDIYRHKFTERMEQVKDKIVLLQQENRRLRTDLKIANYRLVSQVRPANTVDIPTLPRLSSTGT